jgi:formylaminopyrimidine deformylase / aminopyrimidine aminohydrolase
LRPAIGAVMSKARITTATLLERHAELWKVTCRNPFVGGVRDGSLPVETFDRWLVQDRHYVEGLFPAMCRIAAAAPGQDRRIHLVGLRRLLGHLSWFDRTLAARGLDPATPIHPVCRAYVDYAISLGFQPYAVSVVALWAQFRAYRDAWTWAHPGAPKFRSVVRNWCSPEYKRFLGGLGRATDAALAEASRSEMQLAEQAILDVARYELAFWVMTLDEQREE